MSLFMHGDCQAFSLLVFVGLALYLSVFFLFFSSRNFGVKAVAAPLLFATCACTALPSNELIFIASSTLFLGFLMLLTSGCRSPFHESPAGGPALCYLAGASSLFLLVIYGLASRYFISTGLLSTNMLELADVTRSAKPSSVLFWLAMGCFWILSGAWPLHAWLRSKSSSSDLPFIPPLLWASGFVVPFGIFWMLGFAVAIFPREVSANSSFLIWVGLAGAVIAAMVAISRPKLNDGLSYLLVSKSSFFMTAVGLVAVSGDMTRRLVRDFWFMGVNVSMSLVLLLLILSLGRTSRFSKYFSIFYFYTFIGLPFTTGHPALKAAVFAMVDYSVWGAVGVGLLIILWVFKAVQIVMRVWLTNEDQVQKSKIEALSVLYPVYLALPGAVLFWLGSIV